MTILVCSFINEIIFFSKIHGSNIQGRQREDLSTLFFLHFSLILTSPPVIQHVRGRKVTSPFMKFVRL